MVKCGVCKGPTLKEDFYSYWLPLLFRWFLLLNLLWLSYYLFSVIWNLLLNLFKENITSGAPVKMKCACKLSKSKVCPSQSTKNVCFPEKGIPEQRSNDSIFEDINRQSCQDFRARNSFTSLNKPPPKYSCYCKKSCKEENVKNKANTKSVQKPKETYREEPCERIMEKSSEQKFDRKYLQGKNYDSQETSAHSDFKPECKSVKEVATECSKSICDVKKEREETYNRGRKEKRSEFGEERTNTKYQCKVVKQGYTESSKYSERGESVNYARNNNPRSETPCPQREKSPEERCEIYGKRERTPEYKPKSRKSSRQERSRSYERQIRNLNEKCDKRSEEKKRRRSPDNVRGEMEERYQRRAACEKTVGKKRSTNEIDNGINPNDKDQNCQCKAKLVKKSSSGAIMMKMVCRGKGCSTENLFTGKSSKYQLFKIKKCKLCGGEMENGNSKEDLCNRCPPKNKRWNRE